MSTNIQLLSAIRPSDIPAEYTDLVEVLGLDGFLTLVDLCGGQSLYIPKGETLRRDGRDREIRARFNGGNYRALASQFRLSERQIRKIINGTRVGEGGRILSDTPHLFAPQRVIPCSSSRSPPDPAAPAPQKRARPPDSGDRCS